MKDSFLRKHVAEVVDITGSMVHIYTELGLVIPEINFTTGKGTRRRYSRKNVFQCLAIRELVRHGVRLENMHPIVEKVSRYWDEGLLWDRTPGKAKETRFFLVIQFYRDMTVSDLAIYPEQRLTHKSGEGFVVPVQLIQQKKHLRHRFSKEDPQVSALVVDITNLLRKLARI